VNTLNILIIGHKGQVGRELQRTLAPLGKICLADRGLVDLQNPDAIRSLLRAEPFDVVVNAAAYTDVEKAETEPEVASAVNGVAPGIIAKEAARAGAVVIHYSTDYVFDGNKKDAYTEDDSPCPVNVYGRSKLEGERAVAAVGGRWLVFRTSWVYGPRGRNFLLSMLNAAKSRPALRIVNDQVGAPTSSRMIAEATASALAHLRGCGILLHSPQSEFPSGIYHLTASGSTSWFGFAEEIFASASRLCVAVSPQLIPISSAEYVCKAKRPANSVLNSDKLERTFGLRLPDWKKALELVMEELHCAS
jgi:dTDP-4-dehydrorhamnose reductase